MKRSCSCPNICVLVSQTHTHARQHTNTHTKIHQLRMFNMMKMSKYIYAGYLCDVFSRVQSLKNISWCKQWKKLIYRSAKLLYCLISENCFKMQWLWFVSIVNNQHTTTHSSVWRNRIMERLGSSWLLNNVMERKRETIVQVIEWGRERESERKKKIGRDAPEKQKLMT